MKIAVLGMGDSLKEFNPADFELSIGVNDIWNYVKSDVVVCLNKRTVFSGERLKAIDDCKPKAFYSQIVNWDVKPEFIKINIHQHYPEVSCSLDDRSFEKSCCSPFVACQIAYRYYMATEIHLFGVDMVNHPHLDKALCEGIKKHFKNLKTALLEKGCDLIIHGEGILKDI